MNIDIYFSPCPNDTFIFDALVNQKIDTKGLTFVPHLADVEELNRKAFNHELPVTKLSFNAYTQLTHKYILSNSGAALGENVGPLLLAKNSHVDLNNSQLRVAIPGIYTSANFLLNLAYPNLKNKTEIIFSEIENEILNENYDLGLVIHESRFTYQRKGLQKVADLGEWWFANFSLPIPLGAIAINRKLPPMIIREINNLIKESITYAFNNPASSTNYVKKHAQAMEDEVIYNHIKLYVNSYSLNLRERGKNAIYTLFKTALEKGLITQFMEPLFVE